MTHGRPHEQPGTPRRHPRRLSHLGACLVLVAACCIWLLLQPDRRALGGVLAGAVSQRRLRLAPPGPVAAALNAAEVAQALAELPSCRGSAVAGELSILSEVHTWRSARAVPEESVTLITQLSLNRLHMLQAQCAAWHDRIAAAVYIPVVENFGVYNAENATINGSTVAATTAALSEWHRRAEAEAGGCVLDLELSAEVFPTWQEFDPGMYPVNALRNRALRLAAPGELLLLLDADFLPSADLPATYQRNASAYAALAERLGPMKKALVLPAFETRAKWREGHEAAARAARKGKAHVTERFFNGVLPGFHLRQYRDGHGSTNYTRWANATEPYPVRYRSGYEPYILVARRHVPWFDERFRGHEMDKVVHLRHMNATGVEFEVHPAAYVVHMHHRTSRVQLNKRLRSAMLNLSREVLADIRAGSFVPVTSFPALCR